MTVEWYVAIWSIALQQANHTNISPYTTIYHHSHMLPTTGACYHLPFCHLFLQGKHCQSPWYQGRWPAGRHLRCRPTKFNKYPLDMLNRSWIHFETPQWTSPAFCFNPLRCFFFFCEVNQALSYQQKPCVWSKQNPYMEIEARPCEQMNKINLMTQTFTIRLADK